MLESKLAQMGWYTEDKEQLLLQFKDFFKHLGPKTLNSVKALILPHAGYYYSGQVAATCLNEIFQEEYKRVVVIGPSHSVYMPERVSVLNVSEYKTPLGLVSLDNDFINQLRLNPYVDEIIEAHQREHSVQIEIPFLQYALKKLQIVPIVCGELSLPVIRNIAETLLSLIDNETLVVISSDFTHYGQRFNYLPFKDQIKNNLKKIDYQAYEYIASKNLQGFYNYINETKITICGRYPILILLAMLNSDSTAHLLEYQTSADLTDDLENSVSYLGAAVTGQWHS